MYSWYLNNETWKQFSGYITDFCFSETAKWIQACHRAGEPFFGYLATNAPHIPHCVPERYRKPYRNRVNLDVASYFGMVANIDENIGKLDSFLHRENIADNTILIFMSDNGGDASVNVFNAGMRGRKSELYEGGHRQACFIRWPSGGLSPARDIGALAQIQDILPTLIELCGLRIAASQKFDGSSLAPLLRGSEEPQFAKRFLVVQFTKNDGKPPAKWDCAILWNRWRLVFGKELYNLDSDPGQQKDIAAAHPEVVKPMRDHYEKWWTAVTPSVEAFVPISVGWHDSNAICLWSQDRLAPTWLDEQNQVRSGATQIGLWHIMVEREGDYEISLRRWPEEANAGITAPLPAHQWVDREIQDYWKPEGKALPIVGAKIQIAGAEYKLPVGKDDNVVRFRVKLQKGETQLQSWFLDEQGAVLCGAYYTYVQRLV